MGMFDADFAAADDLFAEAFGCVVSLCRGGGAKTEGVTAEVFHFSRELEGIEEQPQQNIEQRGYLVAVADYKIRGVVSKPQVGDFITEIIAGRAVDFQILPEDGKPAVQHFNDAQTRWLIRTKRS